MRAPVETVRVSSRAREILVKLKRRTGLEHWNEICRVAFCRSLADDTLPEDCKSGGDTAIEMEWKTFAGTISAELSTLLLLRATEDGIDATSREAISPYFRAHLERGIYSLQSISSLSELVKIMEDDERG